MTLKNILIVVDNIEKSKKFYHDLFGLSVVREIKGRVVLTEGLVLQDRTIWEEYIQCEIRTHCNASLIYFEEYNIEAFAKKLETLYPDIIYLNKLKTYDFGQKVLRFYDFDGHLIEVRSPAYKTVDV